MREDKQGESGVGGEELTQHGGLVDVKAADADGGVSVRVVAVDDHLPVVDALGEADATQHHPVVEAAAGHAEVVVGEYHVRGSRGGVEREPGHCNEKKHCNWSVVVGNSVLPDAVYSLHYSNNDSRRNGVAQVAGEEHAVVNQVMLLLFYVQGTWLP